MKNNFFKKHKNTANLFSICIILCKIRLFESQIQVTKCCDPYLIQCSYIGLNSWTNCYITQHSAHYKRLKQKKSLHHLKETFIYFYFSHHLLSFNFLLFHYILYPLRMTIHTENSLETIHRTKLYTVCNKNVLLETHHIIHRHDNIIFIFKT